MDLAKGAEHRVAARDDSDRGLRLVDRHRGAYAAPDGEMPRRGEGRHGIRGRPPHRDAIDDAAESRQREAEHQRHDEENDEQLRCRRSAFRGRG